MYFVFLFLLIHFQVHPLAQKNPQDERICFFLVSRPAEMFLHFPDRFPGYVKKFEF